MSACRCRHRRWSTRFPPGTHRRRESDRLLPRGLIPRSSITCCAVVGLMRPKLFALGAASAPPKACNTARAHGCAGDRSPTVSCPPVTTSRARALRRSTSVNGPGQNARAQNTRIVGNVFRPFVERVSAADVNDDRMIRWPTLWRRTTCAPRLRYRHRPRVRTRFQWAARRCRRCARLRRRARSQHTSTGGVFIRARGHFAGVMPSARRDTMSSARLLPATSAQRRSRVPSCDLRALRACRTDAASRRAPQAPTPSRARASPALSDGPPNH